MKGSTRAAMALGIGYLLGRNRKLRTATVMAVATAAGGTNVGSLVMRRGAKMLVSSGVMDKVPPQVGDLVEVVRGDLLQAGKGAATAAVSSRIDSLTDSLHDRAERLRNPGEAVAEGAGAAGRTAGKAAGGAVRTGRETAGSATRRLRGRRSEDDVADQSADEPMDEPVDEEAYADEAAEDEDEYAEDEYAEDDYDEAEPEERDDAAAEEREAPARRGRTRRPVSRTRR